MVGAEYELKSIGLKIALLGNDALPGREAMLPRSPGCWDSILLWKLAACICWKFCIMPAIFILLSFCMAACDRLLDALLGTTLLGIALLGTTLLGTTLLGIALLARTVLGRAVLGELLESNLVADDEFKLPAKVLTADWATEAETGVLPEKGNIADDVIAAKLLVWANAANPLVALMGVLELPKGNPPVKAAPKDGKMAFVADGNKKFGDVMENRGLCNPLKPGILIICCL